MTLPGWEPTEHHSELIPQYRRHEDGDHLLVTGNVGRATLHVEVHGDSTRDAARRLLHLRQIIREIAADPTGQTRQPEIPAAVLAKIEALREVDRSHSVECNRTDYCDDAGISQDVCEWHAGDEGDTSDCPPCTCAVEAIRELLQAVEASK